MSATPLPLSPMSEQAEKEAWVLPPLVLAGSSTVQALDYSQEPSPHLHPLTTTKIPNHLLSLLSEAIFTQAWEPILLSPESLIMWVINFQTLLLHAWQHHQSQYPNLILDVGIPICSYSFCSLEVQEVTHITYCYWAQRSRSFAYLLIDI